MKNTIIDRKARIGTIGNARITLSLEIREHKHEGHKRTVDMEVAPETYYELAICGDVRETGVWDSGGQCQDTIRDLIKEAQKMEFNGSGTLGDLIEILDIWDRWHLNDMHSGTRRQETAVAAWQAEGNKYDYTEAKVALVRKNLDRDLGYSYGSAWLLEVLPPETQRRVIELFEKFSPLK